MCEPQLICDLAETYHILNYKELLPELVAVLVLGLRDNSRVKMFLSGTKTSIEQMLLAIACDNLVFQSWTHSKDASKGKPYKEKSILKALNGEYENEKDDLLCFKTIEEFKTYMKRFDKEVINGE